jgi:hypothetical protein
MKAVQNVVKIYTRWGFRPRHGMMDGEFEPMRTEMLDLGLVVNIASNDEHVPEVECSMRTSRRANIRRKLNN